MIRSKYRFLLISERSESYNRKIDAAIYKTMDKHGDPDVYNRLTEFTLSASLINYKLNNSSLKGSNFFV